MGCETVTFTQGVKETFPKKERSFGTLATKKELLLVFLGILEIHMTTRQCKSGSEQNGLGLGLEKVQNFRRLRK